MSALPPPPSGAPAARPHADRKGRVAMMVGAAALTIGAVLPWISGSIGEFSTSRSGIDGGDGWFFVVRGALIALAAWQSEQRRAVVLGDRRDDRTRAAVGLRIL